MRARVGEWTWCTEPTCTNGCNGQQMVKEARKEPTWAEKGDDGLKGAEIGLPYTKPAVVHGSVQKIGKSRTWYSNTERVEND